ncbi:hypothetical protein E0L36_06015 [Streptomyces sp. AJS327]|uniref:DUF6011 domain-containing protein n=1 Tax=Streptomyces sp. AJS327 TaxID=2545265 RepID=UPI0015DFCFC4|nr:DUF6011 domain-containing protein [Streptomyces sp. AJS327]MBA0050467.1 hypothetical protein [Streptomyces sp. AJS327]
MSHRPDEPLPDSVPEPPDARHCRMCGAVLRDRVSRMWGLGPDCRAKVRLRLAPDPPPNETEQEALPGT